MTQEEAFKILMSGKNVLITGQAGTGKTHLLRQFIKTLKKKKANIGITASTGIAATHLNGVTIHSWCGMGIKEVMTPGDIKKLFTKNKAAVKRVQEAEILIIDEISMLHAGQLDMVDQICRAVRTGFGPFGGLQVVLCGDFFQLPPITRGEISDVLAHNSSAWKMMDLQVCYLEKQYRQTQGNKLHKVLNEIRDSRLSEESKELLAKRLNHKFKNGVIPTKLFTHNSNVDEYNAGRLANLPGRQELYRMKSSKEDFFVKQMKKGCMAPEELRLKVGAVVMFVFNNFAKGYVNGTTGTVIGFEEETNLPIVRTFRGKEIVAAPIRWASEHNANAWIEQIPLRLAWAITVHKSQGMTLDYAEVDLGRAFTYGLGYVALSRVRELDGLSLIGLNEMALLVSEEAKELDKTLRKS